MATRKKATRKPNPARSEPAQTQATKEDVQRVREIGLQLATSLSRGAYAAHQKRMAFGGRQDIVKTLGYAEAPTFADYWSRYTRQDVARRIIDLPVEKTWGGGPLEIEGFPDWLKLSRRLGLRAKFAAVDRLAGLGEFAVLLLGVRGGEEDPTNPRFLEMPVERLGSLEDLTFVQQYSRGNARIVESDDDFTSPRFSMPTVYEIDIPKGYRSTNETTDPLQQNNRTRVHWTRIIHVVADPLENEIIGEPRLKTVLDRLHDLDKTVGGGSEMFWQGADRALVANMQSGFGGDPAEREAIKQDMEEFYLGLRRILAVRGVEVSTLPAVNPTPGQLIDAILTLIAAAANIPKRILFGSERGELASIQDRNNFADTIAQRRESFAEPFILRKFLERLEMWGLVGDTDALNIKWPTLDVLSPEEKAKVAETRARAALTAEQAYVMGSAVTDREELRAWLGLDDEQDDITGSSRADLSVDEFSPEVRDAFDRSRNRSRNVA